MTLERSPPTLAAVGVWISGACWPTRGIIGEFADRDGRQHRPCGPVPFLDQRQDPPFAVAGKAEFGGVDKGATVGSSAVVFERKAGLVARLSTAAGKGPIGLMAQWTGPLLLRRAVARFRRRLRDVEGDSGVGDGSSFAIGRLRRSSGSAPGRRLPWSAQDQVRAAFGRFEHRFQGLATGAWEFARRRGGKALRRDLGRRGRGARSPAASRDKSRRRKQAGESNSESTGAHRRHVIEGIGATSRPSNAANGRHIGCARP